MNPQSAWLGNDESALVSIAQSHQLLPDVAEAFSAMQQAAEKDGQDIQIASSYRSFERQLAIWNRKWQGELPLYDREGNQLNTATLSDTDKVYAILIWSALPGGSRHHWGTDLDVFDRVSVNACGGRFDMVDSEYRPGGSCYALAQWMDQHLEEFGFYRPYLTDKGGVATELWHLSHVNSAKPFEAARSQQALHQQLLNAPIEGKDTVLHLLDELYPRYVLNEGVVKQ